jgi:hypothetical protein
VWCLRDEAWEKTNQGGWHAVGCELRAYGVERGLGVWDGCSEVSREEGSRRGEGVHDHETSRVRIPIVPSVFLFGCSFLLAKLKIWRGRTTCTDMNGKSGSVRLSAPTWLSLFLLSFLLLSLAGRTPHGRCMAPHGGRSHSVLSFISFFLLLSSLILDSPFCENLPNSIRKPVRATTGIVT